MRPTIATALVAAATAAVMAASPAKAQTPPAAATPAPAATPAVQPPAFATTKVEGTEGVYIFRYQGHQSMFVVTSAGVIATDPIGLRRPQAVQAYIAEIKKVTDKPIKYVIYSHSHWDHAAGGKAFKDLGAKFIAHKNARAQIKRFPHPEVVLPDEVVDAQRTITLGDTRIELLYVGRNHSDNSLVMRLPKEKIIFAVDFIPIQTLLFRNLPDTVSPPEWEQSLKRVLDLDWDRLIPGHPYANGRLGTKQDVKDLIGYMDDLATEVKKAADQGKCTDTAMKEIKLPKYEKWGNYATFLPANVERYCYLNNGN